MDFKILLLVFFCAVCKSEKEFDMLVRLDPRACPDAPSKCRRTCSLLNFQIGFCNSNKQCVCVKESHDDSVSREDSPSLTSEQARYAKHDSLEGQVTFFLSRILRLGVSQEKMFRYIKRNPLFRLMAAERMESSGEERRRESGEDDSQNDKKLLARKRTIRLRTEIVPIIIFRNQNSWKAEVETPKWEAEQRAGHTASPKNSLLQESLTVAEEEPVATTKMPKNTSGTWHFLKAPKQLDNGRSDTKYVEEGEYESQVANDDLRDARKIKEATGPSIESVRIFLFPTPPFGDEVKAEPKEENNKVAANKKSESSESLREQLLSSFLSLRTQNIADEDGKTTENSKKNVESSEKIDKVIGKRAPLTLEAETKANGMRVVTARKKSERPKEEDSGTDTQLQTETATDKVSTKDYKSPAKSGKTTTQSYKALLNNKEMLRDERHDPTTDEPSTPTKRSPSRNTRIHAKTKGSSFVRTRRRVLGTIENENELDYSSDDSIYETSAEDEEELD